MKISRKEKRIPSWEERSQLRVAFGGGGTMFLLHWYEYNQGHHIVVARSERSVESTFAALLKKFGGYRDFKVEAYHKVNVVAPPKVIVEAFALGVQRDEVNSFKFSIVHHTEHFYERFKRYPKGLVECKNYVYEYYDPEDPESENQSESEDEHHWSCKSCYHRVNLESGTWEELYERHRETYDARYPPHMHQDESWVVSRAPEGDPKKQLYTVRANYGDHRNGIILDEKEPTPAEAYYNRNVLFYYQDPVDLDFSEFNARNEALIAVHQARAAEREKQLDRDIAADRDKDIQFLLSIFTDDEAKV